VNISTYIFGSLGNGYSQYPNDYTQTIFQSIYAQSSAPTQIAVHREDKLIYYTYVRKLEKGQYIGFCVVLNSVMLTDFKEMFSIFENIITSLVVNGIILQFNDNGDIVSKARQLYTSQAEISHIADNLRSEFAKLENTSKVLPPISYSIAKNEKRTFSIDDNINDIVKASVSYNYTFIFKEKDFDTQPLSSYRCIVSRLNKETLELKKKNTELQEKNKEILRQKKQFRNVVLLTLVIIVCGIGIYFLNDNLNNTQGQLAEANETIDKKNTIISNKNDRINSLKQSIDSLQIEYNSENIKRLTAEEKLKKACNPFIVTSCSVSSEKFSFDYEALEDKEITVTLKAVNEKNSEVVSNSHTLTFYKGGGKKEINLDYKLRYSDYYYVVLMYDDKIIAGKRW